ncbi:MAG TPA: ArsC/Spx/MgsR family protein [Chitinophagaceae bacterium]
MKKVFYLENCTTSRAILKETGIDGLEFTLRDVKQQRLTPGELDELKQMAGSYEKLFSRRALKYKELGLKDQSLGESDFRRFILQEYTFLKRPVVVIGSEIFVGSEKKTVAALKQRMKKMAKEIR